MSVSNFESNNPYHINVIELKEHEDFDIGSHSNAPHNYYNEYRKLYLANVILTSQMKTLISDKKNLLERVLRLEREEEQDSSGTRARRHRRPANEIHRHYKCKAVQCQKSYGSEGSLNQHLRLKHPDIYVEPLDDSSHRKDGGDQYSSRNDS